MNISQEGSHFSLVPDLSTAFGRPGPTERAVRYPSLLSVAEEFYAHKY